MGDEEIVGDARLVLTREELGELICNEHTFFLDWEVYSSHSYQKCKCRFLSLGEFPSTWAKVTLGMNSGTYEELLSLATAQLSGDWGKSVTRDQARVLVGNMLFMVSGFVDRTILQLGRVSEKRAICLSRIEDDLPLAQTSSDSNDLIKSPKFQQLVQALLASSTGIELRNLTSIRQVKGQAQPTKKSFLKFFYLAMSRLTAVFTKNNRFLIISSYLGRRREFLLNLRLRQLPLLSEIRDFSLGVSDCSGVEFRETRKLEISQVLDLIVSMVVPCALRQPPKNVLPVLESHGWSKTPKVIFTSNSFDSDDAFKLYLAHHFEEVTYLVGQHGNNYGVTLLADRAPEVESAGLFLGWGQSDYVNGKRVGVLKPDFTPRRRARISSFILLLRDPMKGFLWADPGYANARYAREIIDLIDSMLKLRIPTRVRPHWSSSKSLLEKIRGRFGQDIMFSMSDLATGLRAELRSSFPIFTYDSTGMLELASSGFDFIAYIPDGLDLVNSNVQSLYGELEGAGVLSTRMEDAVEMIEKIGRNSFECDEMQRDAISSMRSSLATRNPQLMSDLRGVMLKAEQKQR